MIRLAINGYGRIGRCILRALYENNYRNHLQVVAINEPADLTTITHLTKYDSTHGRFIAQVKQQDACLIVNDDRIAISHETDIDALNWSDHNVDIVLECSGQYDQQSQIEKHLKAGAKRVLLSQPGQADIKTLVYGLNHNALKASDQIISAASCTSNSLVPVIDVLHKAFGIEHGVITTIHSLMNDQPVLDAYHNTDLRKTRAASDSIIPVNTGLAAGIERLLPQLKGRFEARALRVPVTNVSLLDVCVQLTSPQAVENVNNALQLAAENELIDILGVSDEPLASCDYNHDTRSAIVDLAQTRCSGSLAHILLWFDNEWAFANRMLDLSQLWSDRISGG